MSSNRSTSEDQGQSESGGTAVEGKRSKDVVTEAQRLMEQSDITRKKALEMLVAERDSVTRRLSELDKLLGNSTVVHKVNGHRGRPLGSKNKKPSQKGRRGPRGPREGSSTNMVLRLVQTYAPSRDKAKTKRELTELAKKDAKFKKLSSSALNSGLQANRAPKMKNPTIDVMPGEGGTTRGGKYFAVV